MPFGMWDLPRLGLRLLEQGLVSNRDGEGWGTWWAEATSPGEKVEEEER